MIRAYLLKINISKVVLLLLNLCLLSCATTQPINDFFGIKMDEAEYEYFVIKSYSVQKGVNYQSTPNMNPLIYAWAEIEANKIRIKVVNDSNNPIFINYNYDKFTLVNTKNEEFILDKGQVFDYPKQNSVAPNNSIEFVLNLPSDFWSTVGMKDQQSVTAIYNDEFWTGTNKVAIFKENLKHIAVSLGGELIIFLKPVTG